MVLDGTFSQEYPVNGGVLQVFTLDPTPFLIYINDLADVICNINIYNGDTTIYSKYGRTSDLWQQLNWLLKWNLTYETLWTGSGSDLLISMLEKLFDQTNNTGAIDVKMDVYVLEEK